MTERATIDVLIVDDHPVFRRGLAAVLGTDPALRVVGQAADGAEGLELFRRLQPAVVMMDLRMPRLNGIEALRTLLAEFPTARVVVMSSYEGDADIRGALAAGARAYLLKDASDDDVLKAVHAVHNGRRYLPPAVAERMAESMMSAALSPRELEVLQSLAQGHSNKQIAASLGIEENTVKVHVRSILGKLGVDQRTEAAVVALQRGLVHLQ